MIAFSKGDRQLSCRPSWKQDTRRAAGDPGSRIISGRLRMNTEDHAPRRRMQSESDAAHRRVPGEAYGTTSANDAEHWRKTTRLMLTHLALWIFFGYVIHMFVVPLNNIVIPVLGFPLGFYMAAQGFLIAFVVMLFVFARQQDNIDREHGVAEED
jgi:putative solute:sodium symporter small subunit